MSKIRKLIGFALALAFAMAMLPAMAFADTSYYDLYVMASDSPATISPSNAARVRQRTTLLRKPLRWIMHPSRMHSVLAASIRG